MHIFSCVDSVQKIVEALIEANGHKRVIALSSSYGKDIIPRLAGKYGANPISEVVQVIVCLS